MRLGLGKGDRELKRAIELSPNSVQARDSYWKYLNLVGRFDQALDEINKILELEPLSPLFRRYPVVLYYFARRHDESVIEIQKLPELRDPSGKPAWRAWPLVFLANNYTAAGRYDEALAACDQIRTLMTLGADLWADTAIVCAHAGAGQRDEAQKILDIWTAREDGEALDPVNVAAMYAALGYTDDALKWLTQAYEEHYAGIVWLKVHPSLDPLRSDPRFQDLLHRMNFPE